MSFWWGFAAGFGACAVLVSTIVMILGRMWKSG